MRFLILSMKLDSVQNEECVCNVVMMPEDVVAQSSER